MFWWGYERKVCIRDMVMFEKLLKYCSLCRAVMFNNVLCSPINIVVRILNYTRYPWVEFFIYISYFIHRFVALAIDAQFLFVISPDNCKSVCLFLFVCLNISTNHSLYKTISQTPKIVPSLTDTFHATLRPRLRLTADMWKCYPWKIQLSFPGTMPEEGAEQRPWI